MLKIIKIYFFDYEGTLKSEFCVLDDQFFIV